MRHIDKIVVHCSATKPGQDFGADDIDRWHKERGWSGIGYHHVIRLDGTIEEGRDIHRAGAHVRGYNAHSIGICLIGGLNEFGKPYSDISLGGFAYDQLESLAYLLDRLGETWPDAAVIGHRDLDPNKECPCFDVGSWWLGV